MEQNITMIKQNLDEVSLMRPILIVLLVVFHAFCPYDGNWEAFAGFEQITVYKWLDRGVFAFMLESFVFISGYIWSYQRNEFGRKENLKQLVQKKFNRLIVPSIVFSILYLLLFSPNMLTINGLMGGGIYEILRGAGHLWFLPMLFWCFVYTYLLEQIKISPTKKLILSVLLMVFTILPDYFHCTRAFIYLPFFYGGYYVRQNIMTIKKTLSLKLILLLWLGFVLSFILLYFVRDNYLPNIKTISSSIFVLMDYFCRSMYAGIGTMAFFMTALVISNKFRVSGWILEIGKYCFGVYIWQQFILKFMYYNTCIFAQSSPYIIPWIGATFALVLSILLAKATKNI